MKKSLHIVITYVFILNTLMSYTALGADEGPGVPTEPTTRKMEIPLSEKKGFPGFKPTKATKQLEEKNFVAPYNPPEYKYSNRKVLTPPFQKNDIAAAASSGFTPEPLVPRGTVFDTTFTAEEKDTDGDNKVDQVKLTPREVKAQFAKDAELAKIAAENMPSKIREMLEQDRLDAIKKIKQNTRSARAYQANATTTEDWERTTWGQQTRRFPTETIMFFFSLSLINGGMMMNDYAQSPLALEQHLKTLVDPIGHMSFYAFMIVNGYAGEFLNNRNLGARISSRDMVARLETLAAAEKLGIKADDVKKAAGHYADRKSWNPYRSSRAKSAYLQLVPYMGMSAGSMASHFTGDFLRTMQSCVQSFYKPANKQGEKKEVKESANLKVIKDRLNHLSDDPCDVAWREWTIEKKFNMYAPALMSMIASTWASGVLTGQYQRFKASEFYKGRAAALGNLGKSVTTFRFAGAEMITSAISSAMGGIATKGMKILGHFTQITLFTGLDTIMHSWIEDVVLNVTYGNNSIMPNPNSFPRKAELIFDLIDKETKEKFSNDTPACEKDIQSGDCKTKDIEGALYNFGDAVLKWKEFNQTKAMQAHSQWVEMINKYQYMEQLSKSYYERFIYDLKTSHGCMKDLDKCKHDFVPPDVDKETFDAETRDKAGLSLDSMPEMTNLKLFPLYGVDPIFGKGEDPKNWKDFYLHDNYGIQSTQQKRVNAVGQSLENYLKTSSDSPVYKAQIDKIVKALKSDDLNQNAHGINMMRSLVAVSKGVDQGVQSVLYDHLRMMGSPSPLMNYGQGFTYAYELNSSFRDLVKNAEIPEFFRQFSLTSRYSFAKKTDYLMYNMLCGASVENGGTTTNNSLKGINEYVSGFRVLFVPPRIVQIENDMDACHGIFKFKNSSVLYSQQIQDNKDKKTYDGIFHAIFNNFTPAIKGIIESEKFELEKDELENRKALLEKPLFRFDQWWEKYVEGQVEKQLEDFRRDYESIAVKFLQSQFKDNGTFAFGVGATHDAVMKNSVVLSTLQASRTFSMVLAEVAKANLTPDEYKDLLVDPSKLSDLKPSKIRYKEDILRFQTDPWLQDFRALRTGGTPTVFDFQDKNEKVLAELVQILKGAKIENEKDKDGKDRQIVKINFPETEESKKETKLSAAYVEVKKSEEFEKKITEMNKEFEKSVDAIIEKVSAKLGEKKDAGMEVAKPIRVMNFSKDKMLQLSQDLLSTISTIKFAAFQAARYSEKNISHEERLRQAEAAEREKKRAKCSESKRMGTISKGDGCT